MKKRLIAIASLMFCLAVGTVVSYADAPDDEKRTGSCWRKCDR